MSSLVSEFIINPVARTVRRFSTPFATGSDPKPVRHLSHEFRLDNGDVVAEFEEGSSASFPGISFLRSPDIALGARAPPLLIPQRRYPVRPTEIDVSRPSSARSSPPIFEMDRPDTANSESLRSEQNGTQTQIGSESAVEATKESCKLAADDGMADMRQRIHIIQSSSITFDQKRYLMQQVLTENYNRAKHAKAAAEGVAEAPATSCIQDSSKSTAQDLGFGSTALETLKSWTGLDEKINAQASEQDALPTFVPKSRHAHEEEDMDDAEEDEDPGLELGCAHYKRNVKIQCAVCEKWYTCRLCHDEVEDHILPRRRTRHMLCMLCGHAQRASDTCIQCGESAAQYYCNICKLWSDDVNKPIYHCEECGICRVGHGLDKDFFHCKTCRACIAISTNDHKCIERATDADCPICGDNMFSSPQKVIFMDCGHPIHRNCFNQHLATSYRCPLCSKSLVKMDALFTNLANVIKEQPMPEEFRNVRSVVLCNDCSAKSSIPYHFLGLRCEVCQSFNTVELDRSSMTDERLPSQENEQGVSDTNNSSQPQTPAPENGIRNVVAGSSPGLRSPTPHSVRIESPLRNYEIAEPDLDVNEGDDEEHLDFWGVGFRSDSSGDEDETDDDDDSEDIEPSEVDEEEDDYDNEIVLVGHR